MPCQFNPDLLLGLLFFSMYVIALGKFLQLLKLLSKFEHILHSVRSLKGIKLMQVSWNRWQVEEEDLIIIP